MTSTDTLVQTLVALGATLRLPATELQIDQAERALQCEFPEGMREFYRRCDGIEDLAGNGMWDFYSLERAIERTLEKRSALALVLSDTEALPYACLVCFCDAMIDASAYLFCATRSDGYFNSFFADSGHQGWLVARSYESFVRVFVAQNDNAILFGEK